MRSFLICTFLFVCIESIGQDNFASGFIVKSGNDTIRGLLRNDEEEKLSGQVVFKLTNGTQESYTPSDIHSFGFDGGSTFRLVKYIDPTDKFTHKQHFAKLLFDGINDLYSFIRKDIYFFVGTIKSDTMLLLFDNITTASGQIIEQGNYQNQLLFIKQGCEKMGLQPEKTNYNETDLLKFFIAVDKCLGNEKASSVYYVKPKTITQFFIFAGGLPLGDKYQIMAQGTVKFILPSQSRKTSLNTGIVYLRNANVDVLEDFYGNKTEYEHVTDIFEIPLTIQYDLLENKIRPFIYGGPGIAYKRETASPGSSNVEENFGFTLIAGVGVETHISKKVFFKIDWRYDLLAHFPVIGVGFRLK